MGPAIWSLNEHKVKNHRTASVPRILLQLSFALQHQKDTAPMGGDEPKQWGRFPKLEEARYKSKFYNAFSLLPHSWECSPRCWDNYQQGN